MLHHKSTRIQRDPNNGGWEDFYNLKVSQHKLLYFKFFIIKNIHNYVVGRLNLEFSFKMPQIREQ